LLLWRERQREDWIGAPNTHFPNWRDYVSWQVSEKWNAPKYETFLTESTVRSIGRWAFAYVGGLIIPVPPYSRVVELSASTIGAFCSGPRPARVCRYLDIQAVHKYGRHLQGAKNA
jgi:hypothetical protein